MADQCCCGRIKDCDEPLIINDYMHEPLGPEGAFCGKVSHHDVRDLRIEFRRLREVIFDISRIVENPDDRALQQVRKITDKELINENYLEPSTQ